MGERVNEEYVSLVCVEVVVVVTSRLSKTNKTVHNHVNFTGKSNFRVLTVLVDRTRLLENRCEKNWCNLAIPVEKYKQLQMKFYY